MASVKTLLDKATSRAVNYAKAYNEHKTKKSELKAMRKLAVEALDDYNLELSKATYKQWAKEGDPVKTAIRSRVIPGALRFQFKTDDDDYMTIVTRDKVYDVNLPMMQATIGADVFADPCWFNKAEKLAFLVATRLNRFTGNDVNFRYAIKEASKEFDFPAEINPLSDDGVVHALQCVFDSILYIDNPDNPGSNLIHTTLEQDSDGTYYAKEWQVIRESMTRDNGVNSVAICNTSKFTGYILNAMHGVLTNGAFGIVADAPEQDHKPASDDGEGDEE
jgi:hypothetical protein